MEIPPDSTDPEIADPLELSVAAAMSQQYASDSRAFLQSLARWLESALPQETAVQRAGWLGGDKRAVRRVEVTFPSGGAVSLVYALENTGTGPLVATRIQLVGGVRVKNEALPPIIWIEAVSHAITGQAEQNKATRDALRDLL